MYRVVGGVLKAPVDDNGSAIVLTGVGTEYCSFNMNGNIVQVYFDTHTDPKHFLNCQLSRYISSIGQY